MASSLLPFYGAIYTVGFSWSVSEFQNHAKERIDRQTDHSKLLWTNLAQRIFLLKPISRLNPPPPPEMHAQELSSLRCSYKRRRGGGMACGGVVADRPLERCTEAAGKGERGPRGDGSVAMAARVIVFVVVE